MNTWKKTVAMTVIAMFALPASAQQADPLDSQMQEAERRLAAQEVAAKQAEVEAAKRIAEEEAAELARLGEQMRSDAMVLAERHETQNEEYEVRMQEAERRMAEAAQQMAVLSMRQLPHVERIERVIRANRGPVLGVTIGSDEKDADPVEGVSILGVSPGGAAEEAGLRSGDVITAINGESLSAENSEAATAKLLDFMKGVEAGDALDVEYLRNGKTSEAELTPRPFSAQSFAFQWDGENFATPDIEVHIDPEVRGGLANRYVWIDHDGGFGSMEMVKLTDRLGSYFGTDEGLLIVRAPNNEELKLEDGDVILNIDGREPTSVSHALRILGSYQAGETLEIDIMRDKRKRTLEIVMPDSRRSHVVSPMAPQAVTAPGTVVSPRTFPLPVEDRI